MYDLIYTFVIIFLVAAPPTEIVIFFLHCIFATWDLVRNAGIFCLMILEEEKVFVLNDNFLY